MGFGIVGGNSSSSTGGGSTTVIQTGGYPVTAGWGWLFGGPSGAVNRDIILDGGLRGLAMDGKTQSPILYQEPCITQVAQATINAATTGPIIIPILGGIEEMEFTHVSFRRFSNTIAGLTGRVYSAPSVSSVWPDAAALIPATDLSGLSGRNGKRVDCAHVLGKPTALWYRPVTNGTGTFEITVWGMPKWSLNHIKPAS